MTERFTPTNAASSGIEPDPGFWRTNLEALSVAIPRTLGRNTKAWSIRQAAHMITEGGFEKVSERTMK